MKRIKMKAKILSEMSTEKLFESYLRVASYSLFLYLAFLLSFEGWGSTIRPFSWFIASNVMAHMLSTLGFSNFLI